MISQGYRRSEILEEIVNNNLFRFPTECMLRSIANTCFKRIEAIAVQLKEMEDKRGQLAGE